MIDPDANPTAEAEATPPTPADDTTTTGAPAADQKPGDGTPAEGDDLAKVQGALAKERSAAKAATRRAEEAERRASELELAQVRGEVARSAGLNPEQSAFLKGETEDELEASAAELRRVFKLDRIRAPYSGREVNGSTGDTEPGHDTSELADRVLT